MGVETYKILLDTPSTSPALGFQQYADALKEIVQESDPHFAVGIFGEWGSGKTTLMQAIGERLDDQTTVAVWFSAWRYEKEEHLIVPLLDTIREALAEWGDKHQAHGKVAHKTATTIGKAMKSIVAGLSFKLGIPGAIDVSFDANKSLTYGKDLKDDEEAFLRIPRSFYHAAFSALNGAFKDFVGDRTDRRIVVFVDDLDRCLPQGALDVLESMKLFFDLNGFVFVVGLNQQVVEWCIDSKYATDRAARGDEEGQGYQIRGSDYIKKIFQVPFTLAPVSVTQIDELLNALYLEGGLPQEQQDDIRDRLAPHLQFVVTESGVNPREIKRYVNTYTLLVKMKPHLSRDAMLAIQTLTTRADWRSVRDGLYSYRDIFTDALRQHVEMDETGPLEELATITGSVPQSFLTYVAPGSPGNALINNTPIDEYLYSGEATSGSGSLSMLDLFRNMANLRAPLQDLFQVSESTDPPGTFRVGLQELGGAESVLSAVTGQMEEFVRGPRGRVIFSQLQEIRSKIDELRNVATPFEQLEVDEWNTEVDRRLKQLFTDLGELYRLGPVSSGFEMNVKSAPS